MEYPGQLYSAATYRGTFLKGLVLFFLITNVWSNLRAQHGDTSRTRVDSSKIGFVEKIDKIFKDGAKKSLIEYQEERENLRREKILGEIQKVALSAKAFLKHTIDSSQITSEINHINNWTQIALDGVVTNRGSAQTHRNLVTTTKILQEVLKRANSRKQQLDTHQLELEGFRIQLDSLSLDSVLVHHSSDSATLVKYLQKYLYVGRVLHPIDSGLNQAMSNVYLQQARVNSEVLRLNGLIEEVGVYHRELSTTLFAREFPNIYQPSKQTRSFTEILRVSKAKGELALNFYLKVHIFRVILLLLLVIGATIFITTLKKIFISQKLLREDFKGQLILRFPALSAMIIVFSLFQFIFPDPPFTFNVILWGLSAISLTIVMNRFISRYWMGFWVIMLLLFFAACFLNLVLQASRIERWIMLLLSIAGVIAGSFYLLRPGKNELKERMILYFIGLTVLFEVFAIYTNFYGRYNLGKSLFTIGFLNVVLGILFLWTVRLINEGLKLASSVYTKQEGKLFYINFERLGDKVPVVFYFLMVVAWVILVGRNFYAFQLITEPIQHLFLKERTIGNYSFTIVNIVVFFAVLCVAVIISKIISFFASEKHPHVVTPDGKDRGVGLGSWILLIRVAVICIGLFLALAASGFPLDRITIILGALGVGVGFGLQSLVAHMVSGLVIAFEKPVNVGDIVEVGGQVGTMKSIGFRSSVISSATGADIVIPNGDILNAHLVNWTLGGNKRQITVSLSLSSNIDSIQIQTLLLELIKIEDRVVKYPAPSVLFEEFNMGMLIAKLIFWVRDYREGAIIKSEVIAAIGEKFRQEGIELSHPHYDLHLRTKSDPPDIDSSE